MNQYTFGPVPSRRLGQSLGINNIPAKTCSYSCVYCQVGRTSQMQTDRQAFYDPTYIYRDVQARLLRAKETTAQVDYITFVPDGEPTLDVNLGREITLLKSSGIPVGVITNSSLLYLEGVREELGKADWVSLKVDAVQDSVWRAVDRPHGSLALDQILDGILKFAATYRGKLVTETMLVRGLNDSPGCLEETAEFIGRLRPRTAYLSIPTRPPAEPDIQAPDEAALNTGYQIFSRSIPRVEYLIGYEGNSFAFTDDIEKDLLSITSVHPMRAEAVDALLSRAGRSRDVVSRLLARGDLAETKYQGHTFYLRKFKKEQESAI
jgi:wyosine [tRNA(Phe)-imidazoG37] synthetase (radical SAM superfamily)